MSRAVLSRRVPRVLATLASAIPFSRPGTVPLAGAPATSSRPRALPGRPERRRLRRSLRASVVEGVVAEVVTACAGSTALTAWALALNLGPFEVGVMGALPFLAQFVQFPAAWLTSTFGHRRMAMAVVLVSRLMMLALCALPWLPLRLVGQQRCLLAVAALWAVLGVIGNNAWVAWMAELVPESIRGRFFGRRTAMCTLSNLVMSLLAGVVMDRMRPASGVGLALPMLAGVSVVAGFVCMGLMAQQHDPTPPGRAKVKLDWSAALLPFRDERARRVLLYQVFWNAGVGLSAPFFSFYMLHDLKMSFLLMSVQLAAVAAMRMVSAPTWGGMIDRWGAQPVVVLCSLGLGVLPLVWLLPTATFLWPLLLDAVLAGVLWSGHGLALFSLPLAVAPREGRPFYLAAFSTAGGVAYALATSLGGGLVSALPETFTLGSPLGSPLGSHVWSRLQVLFVLSAVARLGAARLALRIQEPGARGVDSLAALGALARASRRASPEEASPDASLSPLGEPARAEG